MPCGAFKPESTGTIRSARPAFLASGKASTVPSLVSVTSSTPPGLKAICRACGASAKIAIWKPGGSVRRLKSIFSTRVQESKSRQNETENRARLRLTDCSGQPGFSAILCSRVRTQFLYQNRQNYPAPLFFRSRLRGDGGIMCCWLTTYRCSGLAFDLLYTSAGAVHSGRRYFWITLERSKMLPLGGLKK